MNTSDAGVTGNDTGAARNLPASLEPELRKIIDTAVARVAAIELEAIKEARQITQRSEVEAREALKFALDRAFSLIKSLELLATTVNGMAEALKVELDDAIQALRHVPEPESALARELAAQAEPVVEPVVEEPPAAEVEPEPEPEPEPEQPAEPRVKLTPIVQAQPVEEQPAGERELVTVSAGAPDAPDENSRKRRKRRFFSRSSS